MIRRVRIKNGNLSSDLSIVDVRGGSGNSYRRDNYEENATKEDTGRRLNSSNRFTAQGNDRERSQGHAKTGPENSAECVRWSVPTHEKNPVTKETLSRPAPTVIQGRHRAELTKIKAIASDDPIVVCPLGYVGR